ncbi:DUF6415 family natural product biosynthesis protein [Streptomyces colonosanans]|uniref:Uncharacterized protein n=1 Tax=Streptomyces colonosanans TaxID=1428652 RepID=A0A1S2NY67_9ACTN|nr:DUF6415 family natural product biosynthesis protein [Streptomyces colonosanans]OIJ86418.1 hypothetical protein BIV24_26535 [Streptomyces colonosanans]
MSTVYSGLPVRDVEATQGMNVEPARPAARRTLLDLLGALNDSFIQDGIDDYLDRILGWGAAPLEPQEVEKIVPPLQSCLWRLVTNALQRAQGCPDKALIQRIGAATRLDSKGEVDGFITDAAYVRRLAALISDLLDEVSDDDDGPLPSFGAGMEESSRCLA